MLWCFVSSGALYFGHKLFIIIPISDKIQILLFECDGHIIYDGVSFYLEYEDSKYCVKFGLYK